MPHPEGVRIILAGLLAVSGLCGDEDGLDAGQPDSARDAQATDMRAADGEGDAVNVFQDSSTEDALVTDVPVGDAAMDTAGMDSGFDSGISITGVTCVVLDGCGATEPETFEDVPFSFASLAEWRDRPVAGLFSPLYGLRRLYNSDDYVMGAADVAGLDYLEELDGELQIQRRGQVLDVRIDASRGGSCVTGTLIAVQCSGTTTVLQDERFCPTRPVWPDEEAISCVVLQRDDACAEEPSVTVRPRFWLAAGPHGPGTQLRTDEPTLVSVFGSDGVVTFHREGLCSSYALDVRAGPRLIVESGRVSTFGSALSGRGDTTCRDRLGNPQQRLAVQCSEGVTALSPAP